LLYLYGFIFRYPFTKGNTTRMTARIKTEETQVLIEYWIGGLPLEVYEIIDYWTKIAIIQDCYENVYEQAWPMTNEEAAMILSQTKKRRTFREGADLASWRPKKKFCIREVDL
jgi:hypothetical protein